MFKKLSRYIGKKSLFNEIYEILSYHLAGHIRDTSFNAMLTSKNIEKYVDASFTNTSDDSVQLQARKLAARWMQALPAEVTRECSAGMIAVYILVAEANMHAMNGLNDISDEYSDIARNAWSQLDDDFTDFELLAAEPNPSDKETYKIHREYLADFKLFLATARLSISGGGMRSFKASHAETVVEMVTSVTPHGKTPPSWMTNW